MPGCGCIRLQLAARVHHLINTIFQFFSLSLFTLARFVCPGVRCFFASPSRVVFFLVRDACDSRIFCDLRRLNPAHGQSGPFYCRLAIGSNRCSICSLLSRAEELYIKQCKRRVRERLSGASDRIARLGEDRRPRRGMLLRFFAPLRSPVYCSDQNDD